MRTVVGELLPLCGAMAADGDAVEPVQDGKKRRGPARTENITASAAAAAAIDDDELMLNVLRCHLTY